MFVIVSFVLYGKVPAQPRTGGSGGPANATRQPTNRSRERESMMV